jgi:hypothetical protein
MIYRTLKLGPKSAAPVLEPEEKLEVVLDFKRRQKEERKKATAESGTKKKKKKKSKAGAYICPLFSST